MSNTPNPTPGSGKRKVFQSGHLHYAEYDKDSKTLSITFANSQTYNYSSVPPEIWSKLCQADSPGQYLHGFIRPNFRHKRLVPDPAKSDVEDAVEAGKDGE